MTPSRFRKAIVALAALAAVTVLAPATATATTLPAPGYEQFVGCPTPEQNAEITTCFREVTEENGGVLTMGNIEVPLAKPMTMRGGQTAAGAWDNNASGGIVPVKQPVPGGVVGLTGLTWLEEFVPPEGLLLYAEITLATTPGDQLAEPAYRPIKVRMVNATLGNNCYIGSGLKPIKLQLAATVSPTSSGTMNGIEHLSNGTHFDNTYEVPGASGCVLTLFGFIPVSINGVINEQSGLPAAEGESETIQEFDTELVSSELVYP